MRRFLTSVGALAVMVATSAQAFEGGWYYDNNRGGSEILYLGDNTDDTYLRLSGTRGWCGSPGASYATMRRVIGAEYDQITWWIDAECGNTVRVCVENSYGRWACSSYRSRGWVDGR